MEEQNGQKREEVRDGERKVSMRMEKGAGNVEMNKKGRRDEGSWWS